MNNLRIFDNSSRIREYGGCSGLLQETAKEEDIEEVTTSILAKKSKKKRKRLVIQGSSELVAVVIDMELQ
jgi:hypothetical protein